MKLAVTTVLFLTISTIIEVIKKSAGCEAKANKAAGIDEDKEIKKIAMACKDKVANKPAE